jgi:hypothetical protein
MLGVQTVCRWALAVSLAALIPLTVFSNGCQKTVVEPQVDSGSDIPADLASDMPFPPDVSGTEDAATDLDSGGDTSDDATADALPTCCYANDVPRCLDGNTLAICNYVPNTPCGPSPFYGYIWKVQACPAGCAEGIEGGARSSCR